MGRIFASLAVAALVFGGALRPAEAKPEPVRLLTYFGVSPDGSTLVFSWRGDLWSKRLGDGPMAAAPIRRLTRHPGDDTRPHFSPDGKMLAFVSTRSGAEQIWLMKPDGTDLRQITVHSEGARVYGWFPDSRAVLMRAKRDHHWRHSERLYRKGLRANERPELLFDDYGYLASVSPDGNTIAFTREGRTWWRKGYRGPAASQVWLFDRTKRTFTKITDGDHGERWPMWQSNGQLLLTSQQDGTWNLWRHDVESGERTQLTKHKDDGVVFPTLSADGTVCVYRQGFDLHALTLKDGTLQDGAAPSTRTLQIQISGDPVVESTSNVSVSRATSVAFTKDGREVAFIAGDDLWVMDTELREPKRITAAAPPEREPLFSDDMETLYFISDAGGQSDIWAATRSDADRFWWQNDTFQIKRLTNDVHTESDLQLVPGKQPRLAFVREGGGLWTCKTNGSDIQEVVSSWNAPQYCFSPDGTWVAYAVGDNNFNWDVWIKPMDGSHAPINVSMHPDEDSGPQWSPDGTMLAFTGRRWGDESDICLVYLQQELDEQGRRDRAIKKALDKMKGRKKKGAKKGNGAKKDKQAEANKPFDGTWLGRLHSTDPFPKEGLLLTLALTNTEDTWSGTMNVLAQLNVPLTSVTFPKPGASVQVQAMTALGQFEATLQRDGKKLTGDWTLGTWAIGTLEAALREDDKPDVLQVDLDGIQDRVRRVPIEQSYERNLIWSPDSKLLAFEGELKGARGVYTIAPPETLAPKKLTSAPVSHLRWLKEGKQITGLSAGAPMSMTTKGLMKKFAFRVQQTIDIRARHVSAFDMAWRAMRDNFYDPNMAGRDWNAIRAKYRPVAAQCATRPELEQLCNLMLGELNASHMGFRALGAGWNRPGWRPVTRHLGIRFDRASEGEGLLVVHVIRGSPADRAASRILVGERVLSIDGYPLGKGTNLTTRLTLEQARDVRLKVANPDGEERVVLIRPVAVGVIRRLLYEDWMEQTRADVKTKSAGRFGYLHVRGMNWSSFERFEAELYKIGHGKDGLLIDVRENGGGFTTDHLLTCLTQPHHAFTVPRGGGRGYPQGRMVYARWNKPIVVLCNQNSFSNAEIFAHAIQGLGRGRIVGVQTAGGVISTGSRRILDVGTLRMPFRGWFLAGSGKDMELNGCKPDIEVWPLPGDWEQRIDRQLDAAIEALTEDVAKWNANPRPDPKRAPKPWPPR